MSAETMGTMNDDPTIEVLKGTAMFARKVSDGNYGHREASAYVQFDASQPKAARGALTEAQMAVLDELGVEYVYDAERDTVVEKPVAKAVMAITPTAAQVAVGMTARELEAAFPTSTAVSPNAFPQPAVGGVPPCPICGGGMWDNRASATGKQPQAKCKNAGKWNGTASVLPNGQPGCRGVIFDIAKGK